MEQVLAQAKVKITPASKIWDAQRAYEKRLTTTMSKDKGILPFPRRGAWLLTLCQHSPLLEVEDASGKTQEQAAVLKRWKPSRSLQHLRNRDHSLSANLNVSHLNQNLPHPLTRKEWKQTRIRINLRTSRMRKRKRRRKMKRRLSNLNRKHQKLHGRPDGHQTRYLHELLRPVLAHRRRGPDWERRTLKWKISNLHPLLHQNRHRSLLWRRSWFDGSD